MPELGRKYGWAKEQVLKFIMFCKDEAGRAAPWCELSCPDEYGRSQMQVYRTIHKMLSRSVFGQYVEVKVLPEYPNSVWLHRLDIDDSE